MYFVKKTPEYFRFLIHFYYKSVLSKRSNFTLLIFLLFLTPVTNSVNTYAHARVHKRTTKKSYCTYTVKAGDTLFDIARTYHLSLKLLAITNHITPPYKIVIGQKIKLPHEHRKQCLPRHSSGEKRGSQKSLVSLKYEENKNKEKTRLLSRHTIYWTWPVKAYTKVTDELSLHGAPYQALVIQGKSGTKVDAAASGVVMYAGNDVSGYGKLVIIEHNRSYLSIYGNNKEVFVYKGDVVKAGQEIAEIGSTGMQEPKLHFEIRRNGKPVDPLYYLPKRLKK